MAAFYFGSDTVIDEETGEEMTTAQLIEEGRRVQAEMAAEEGAETLTAGSNDLLCEEMGYPIDEPYQDPAYYSLSTLIYMVSGEDVNGMKGITYRSWCEDIMESTEQEDRDYYYRTGVMVGSVAEMARWYGR